jgi:type I restriction enzyme S subunit
MAAEWFSSSLEELASKESRSFAMGPFGSNIRSENYQKTGVPVIRGTNLSERGGPQFISDDFVFLSEDKANQLSSSTALSDDLVFVAQGTVGKVGLVPRSNFPRYILSQNLGVPGLKCASGEERHWTRRAYGTR